MTRDADLTWRTEEACLAAWPAPRAVLMDGWLLRFGGGHTSRANSVNVVGPSRAAAAGKVADCAALYRGQGLRPIFRLSSALPQADLAPALDEAGYGPPREGSLVLYRGLDGSGIQDPAVALVDGRPDPRWRTASACLAGLDATGAALRDRILDSFVVPVAFAALEVDGEVAATALCAVHGGIACFNAVATDPRHRGRGLATRTVAALLAWAERRHGASGACLQVVDGNAAALALYRGLGFRTEVSRYHYRDAPGP